MGKYTLQRTKNFVGQMGRAGRNTKAFIKLLGSNADETAYGNQINISEQKMYQQQGKHFNKHGKDMGYTSKKAYEQGARDFINTNKNLESQKFLIKK